MAWLTSRLAILESLRVARARRATSYARPVLDNRTISNHLGCLRECGRYVAIGADASLAIARRAETAAVLLMGDTLLEQVSELVANCANYDCGGSASEFHPQTAEIGTGRFGP